MEKSSRTYENERIIASQAHEQMPDNIQCTVKKCEKAAVQYLDPWMAEGWALPQKWEVLKNTKGEQTLGFWKGK